MECDGATRPERCDVAREEGGADVLGATCAVWGGARVGFEARVTHVFTALPWSLLFVYLLLYTV